MVSGPDDVVMGLVADEPYQLRTRVTERASQAINQLVDKDPRMKEAEEERPGDDRLSAERLEAVKEERRHRIRTELGGQPRSARERGRACSSPEATGR